MPDLDRPVAYCRKDMNIVHPIGACPYDADEQEAGPMTEIERAVWTLMCTDDYRVVNQTPRSAALNYVHNSPPHPVIIITVHYPEEQ